MAFYYRPDMVHVLPWKEKIERWIKKQYPKTHILESTGIPKQKKHAPDLLIVLGGDGTIIEAAQRFQHWNPLILGLNLGHVGFLASVREKSKFLKGIARVFRREFRTLPRMLMQTSIIRNSGLKDIPRISQYFEMVLLIEAVILFSVFKKLMTKE